LGQRTAPGKRFARRKLDLHRWRHDRDITSLAGHAWALADIECAFPADCSRQLQRAGNKSRSDRNTVSSSGHVGRLECWPRHVVPGDSTKPSHFTPHARNITRNEQREQPPTRQTTPERAWWNWHSDRTTQPHNIDECSADRCPIR
jgi:hypothetical protein